MKWVLLVFLLIGCADNTDDMRLFKTSLSSSGGVEPPTIIDSEASKIRMPDIPSAIYNPVGTGFTCTGGAYDEVATNLRTDGKYVFWIGSDGRSDEDLVSEQTFQGAVVKVAFDREEASNDYTQPMPELEYIDEVSMVNLTGANASVQGICIDKRGYLWVTQFNNLYCVDPSDKSIVGVTTEAEGFQSVAYDWQNDQMYVTDRVADTDTPVHLYSIDGVNGTVTKVTDNIFTIASPSVDIIQMMKDDNTTVWASLGSTATQYDLTGTQIRQVTFGPEVNQTEGVIVVGDFIYMINDRYYHHKYTPIDMGLGDVNAIHKVRLNP